MALLSSPVSSLVNGVSQQPATLRFPSQVEAQTNAYSSVSQGLTKRHPSKCLAAAIDSNASSTPFSSAFTHTINRDSTERYQIIAYKDGSTTNLKAFQMDGTELDIKLPGGAAVASSDLTYLGEKLDANGASTINTVPSDDLKAVTVVDHTWIVNTAKEPLMSASVTPARKNEAMIVFWKYNHAHNYKVRIEEKVFQWRSRTSNVPTTENEKNESKKAAQSQGWLAEKMYILLAGIDADSMAADHNFPTLGDSASTDEMDMHVVSTRVLATAAASKTPSGTGGELDSDSNNGGQGLNGNATTYVDGSETGSAAGNYDQWVVRQSGPILHIYREDGADFDISVVDDNGDDSLTVIKDSVQQLGDLPKKAPDGFEVEVVGDEEGGTDDNYYVRFGVDQTSSNDEAYRPDRQAKATADGNPAPAVAEDNEAFAEGVWTETIAPGIEYKFDDTTMPHKLIRKVGAEPSYTPYFEYAPSTWTDKIVGDDGTNSAPSFINSAAGEGNTIREIFFYNNRLGFLADDNVIFSESAEYDNFWRTTITQLLDSDPIDVGIAHTSVSKVNHAVPFSDSLFLFSDKSQFQLKADNNLTPTTTSIHYMSEFENSVTVRPVPTGKSMFFAQKKNAFSTIREYYQVIKDELMDALDVTAHVPSYIEGNVTKMAGSSHDNILAVLSDGEDSAGTIYIYKYLTGDKDKVQSSWSRYDLSPGAVIKDINWVDTDLMLLVQYQNSSTSSYELFLEKMTIEPGITDEDSSGTSIGFVCHLDRRVTEADCVSVVHADGETTFTLPYVRNEGDYHVLIRKSPTLELPVGSQLTVVNSSATTSNTIVVSGDHTTDEVFIGLKYEMSVELSKPYIKPQPGSPIYATGRYQLMYGHLLFNQTDYLRVEVTPAYRTTRTTIFNGGILGATSAVGGRGTTDGKLKFPIYSRNDQSTIKIINDTPMPSAILGLEYESSFNPRARRIG